MSFFGFPFGFGGGNYIYFYDSQKHYQLKILLI